MLAAPIPMPSREPEIGAWDCLAATLQTGPYDLTKIGSSRLKIVEMKIAPKPANTCKAAVVT